MSETDAPATGQIEVDRSSGEPRIRISHTDASFAPLELRNYADYLRTVADEVEAGRPEPEVDELAAVFDATEARWVAYPDAFRVLARAALAAGYRKSEE